MGFGEHPLPSMNGAWNKYVYRSNDSKTSLTIKPYQIKSLTTLVIPFFYWLTTGSFRNIQCRLTRSIFWAMTIVHCTYQRLAQQCLLLAKLHRCVVQYKAVTAANDSSVSVRPLKSANVLPSLCIHGILIKHFC